MTHSAPSAISSTHMGTFPFPRKTALLNICYISFSNRVSIIYSKNIVRLWNVSNQVSMLQRANPFYQIGSFSLKLVLIEQLPDSVGFYVYLPS